MLSGYNRVHEFQLHFYVRKTMSDPAVQSLAEPVPQPTPGLSQIQRVIHTFTAPSKTFNDIKAGHRSWWLPFLIGLVCTALFVAVLYTRIGIPQLAENTIHQSPKLEQQMADATPENQAKIRQNIEAFIKFPLLGSPIFGLLFVAVLSFGLWGTINFAFGGKAKYSSIFVSWMYAGLPGALKGLLGVIVIFALGAPESFNLNNPTPTNIAAFLNPLETNKALYTLLSLLDVLTIWSLALLAIGTATVAGVKRSSGYVAVFGWFAVFVLVIVGITAAFS